MSVYGLRQYTLFIPPQTIHGIINQHNKPIHLLAFLATSEVKVFYPEDNVLMPVVWESED